MGIETGINDFIDTIIEFKDEDKSEQTTDVSKDMFLMTPIC